MGNRNIIPGLMADGDGLSVLAHSLCHILTVGQQNIAGVIYSVLVDEYGTKRAETGTRRIIFYYILTLIPSNYVLS